MSWREDDEKIKATLAKTKASAPTSDYWATFSRRVRKRIESQPPVPAAEFVGGHSGLQLAFAAALLMAVAAGGGYWLGHRGDHPIHIGASGQLVSLQETPAHWMPLQQILQLYSQQVNWISLVDGKLDFSINALPVAKAPELIPYVVRLSKDANGAVSRWLMRPGQEASSQFTFADGSKITIRLKTSADGKKLTVGCRLKSDDDVAHVEATVRSVEDKDIDIGSLSWGGRLLPLTARQLPRKEISLGNVKNENTVTTTRTKL